MNRIEGIYSFIDEQDKVVDVGCDQAKLSLMLANRGQHSIASDKSINVINRAKKDIGNNKYIDLRVSNGLSNIHENEADTLVVAGMGTFTILEILKNTNIRFKKIITISNNNHDILRIKMNELNYMVDTELIIKENNKYYNLIIFVNGNKNYTEKEIYLGYNHKDKKMYKEYLNYIYNKYLKIKKLSKDKNIKINKILNLIEDVL